MSPVVCSFFFISFVVNGVVAGDSYLNDDIYDQASCDQSECLTCDLSSGACLKCQSVMMDTTRQCVSQCPLGHVSQWRDELFYQGTVCVAGSLLSTITGRDMAVIACAAAGGAVCVGIILGAILYARRQAAQKPLPEEGSAPRSRIPVPRLWRDPRPSAADAPVSSEERKEFLKALGGIRRNAPLLLEMLAETKTRFRGIKGPDSTTDTKSRAYRGVMRDLNRVVGLVARPDDSFTTVPGDWKRLLAWADRLLMSYGRTRLQKCGSCPECRTTAASSTTSPPPQHLFLTRQQVQGERWRRQKEEKRSNITAVEVINEKGKTQDTDYLDDDDSKSDLRLPTMEEDFKFNPNLNASTLYNQASQGFTGQTLDRTDEEMEVSYSQDEKALANQKMGITEERREPSNCRQSVISRIFASKILNATNHHQEADLSNRVKDVLPEEECLSSTSIYDHIEAFTFDDFNPSSKNTNQPKSNLQKEKVAPRISNSSIGGPKRRKPHFPGYSESFKQILESKLLLNIQRSKIQKSLSKKGERLQRMVRRNETRFIKDRYKMDPNSTYDRRNIKSEIVNNAVVGGDVYVSVAKHPVVKRQDCDSSYENLDEVRSEASDAARYSVSDSTADSSDHNSISTNSSIASKDKPIPRYKEQVDLSSDLRCELLTVV